LFSESQDVEDFASNSIELQHVLHNIVPEAIDSPLVKALENHGLMTVQDVLLLNQAEWDAVHSPKLMAVQVHCQLVPRTGCWQSSSLGNTLRMQVSLLPTRSRSQGMSSIDSEALTLTMLLRVNCSPKFLG